MRHAALVMASGRPWEVTHEETGIELVLIPPGSMEVPPLAWRIGRWGREKLSAAGPRRKLQVRDYLYFAVNELTWQQLGGISRPVRKDAELRADLARSPRQPAVSPRSLRIYKYFSDHGLRPPTESEWEYVARSGRMKDLVLEVPDAPGSAAANLREGDGARRSRILAGSERSWKDGFDFSAPVGSFAPNDFAVHDMVGNVMEVCQGRLGLGPDILVDSDPAAVLRFPGSLTVRGASWWSSWQFHPLLTRRSYYRHGRGWDVGYRVVVDLD